MVKPLMFDTGALADFICALDKRNPGFGSALVLAFADNNGWPGPGLIDLGWVEKKTVVGLSPKSRTSRGDDPAHPAPDQTSLF